MHIIIYLVINIYVDNWLAFVKGLVLVGVTDKYSEREVQASSVEGARVRQRRNASVASILLEAQEVVRSRCAHILGGALHVTQSMKASMRG